MYNPAIDGDRLGVGNGIVMFNKQLRIWNPRVLRFTNGYTAWDETAGGDGKGHAIVWSGVHYDGSSPASNNNADDCLLADGFLESIGPEFLTIEPAGIQQQFPDSTIDGVNFMRIQNTTDRANAVDVPSCLVANAGGWRLLELHFNGSPGECLRMDKTLNTRVWGGNYDGWNTKLRAGSAVYAIAARNMIQGKGGSALLIGGMDFRVLDELTSAAQIGLVQARMDQTAGQTFNGELSIGPIVGYRQTPEVSAPTFEAFDLLGEANSGGSGGPRRLHVALQGIRMPLGDTEVFATNFATGDGQYVDIDTDDTCAWVRGTARPTTGNWHVGAKRKHPNPAVGDSPEQVCAAAGAPGTWRAYPAVAAG
jgi:hypothetical protein